MDFANLALAAVILVTLTSLTLLINRDWRISLIALAAQYIGVFILVALEWPVSLAAPKLLAGWMAGTVLGMNLIGSGPAEGSGEDENQTAGPNRLSGQVFRLLAATLAGLVVISIAPGLDAWLPGLTLEQAWGGSILMGVGLLQLGFTTRPFHITLGLLTVISGFEIFYATIEASVLLAGLLAAANLGLALTGGYLIASPFMEDVP